LILTIKFIEVKDVPVLVFFLVKIMIKRTLDKPNYNVIFLDIRANKMYIT